MVINFYIDNGIQLKYMMKYGGEDMSNIVYKSNGFSEYYSVNRHVWNEFYDSERTIMERVMDAYLEPFSVLDVGCGCGGLGEALDDRYTLSFYKGIDINKPNIECAKMKTSSRILCTHEFECVDIAQAKEKRKYDVVISFSCVDFNADVDGMIAQCWKMVADKGHFIFSARLTNESGIDDIRKSYQRISMQDGDNEVANYVVFNCSDLLKRISGWNNVEKVEGYGYWGIPSSTAVTNYNRLCFSVFDVKKGCGNGKKVRLDMPLDLFYL